MIYIQIPETCQAGLFQIKWNTQLNSLNSQIIYIYGSYERIWKKSPSGGAQHHSAGKW